MDYQNFLRQNKLRQWGHNDPLGKELIKQRLTTADEFALWVKQIAQINGQVISEIAANGILVLLSVVCALLNRQIAAQAEMFQREDGFTERLYRMRVDARKRN